MSVLVEAYNAEFSSVFPGDPYIITEYGDTELQELVRGDDMEALTAYLKKNPHTVNQCDPGWPYEEVPPIFSACLTNNKAAAEILFSFGATLNVCASGVNRDSKYYSVTPLHVCVHHDSYEVAVFLLSAGADVNARMDPSGYTALHLAVIFDREKIASHLFHQCGADPLIPSREDLCNYPILKAMFKRDIRMVLMLACKKDQEPDVADSNDGVTALHLAVMQQYAEAVHVLLSHKFDPNAKLRTGHTPLDLIGSGSKTAETMSKALENMGGKRNTNDPYYPSIHLVKDSHVDKLKRALKKGVNVNTRLYDGVSLLQHASETGQFLTAHCLIDNGADVNMIDDYGCTALHVAAGSDDPVMVNLLFLKGADLNAKDFSGCTPLHRAAESGGTMAASALIQFGAELGINSVVSGTALCCAVLSDRAVTAEYLLRQGEPPNVSFTCDQVEGFTPLHGACSCNYLPTIKLLIDHGADVNAPSFTPSGVHYPIDFLPYAKENVLDAFVLMIESGAYIDLDLDPGMAGLDVAAPYSRASTLEDILITADNVEVLRVYVNTAELIYAVRQRDFEAVKMNISEGAIVNCRSIILYTPLILASYLGDLPIVDYLLKNGAVMYMTNMTLSSPLHYAAKYDRRDVAICLLRAGARVTFLCQGRTAIEEAMAARHYEMVIFLVFVGKYLLETKQKTVSPLKNHKYDPAVCKVLEEMGSKRPAKKLLSALFRED